MRVRLHLKRGTKRIFADVEARINAPLPQKVGEAIAGKIRRSPGGLRDQFARGSGNLLGMPLLWPPTQKFGTRPPPKRTLHRTGSLRAAWLGESAESKTRVERRSVFVGVDTSRKPEAGVFQSPRPTKIGITPAMRGKVWRAWGVQFSPSKTHITIFPRRLGISDGAVKASAKVASRYYANGRMP